MINMFSLLMCVRLGDDRMLIERFIEDPHHIEIQVRKWRWGWGELNREIGREEGERGEGNDGREEKEKWRNKEVVKVTPFLFRIKPKHEMGRVARSRGRIKSPLICSNDIIILRN